MWGSIILTVVGVSALGVISYPVVSTIFADQLGDTFYLPLYEVSPYEIFADKVALFDVDFFNPKEDVIKEGGIEEEVFDKDTIGNIDPLLDNNRGYTYITNAVDGDGKTKITPVELFRNYMYVNGRTISESDIEVIHEPEKKIYNGYDEAEMNTCSEGCPEGVVYEYFSSETDYHFHNLYGAEENKHYVTMQKSTLVYKWNEKITYKMNATTVRCYINGIKSMKDADFNYDEDVTTVQMEYQYSKTTEYDDMVILSTSGMLQSTISAWYVTLRNIALVALLSVLVYIGIKITLSSVASDKAKYKQMLTDWVVALCLVFLMHYIMSFAVNITSKITDMLASINMESEKLEEIVAMLPEEQKELKKEIADATELYVISTVDSSGKKKDRNKLENAWDILVDGGELKEGEESIFKQYFFTDEELTTQAGSKDEANVFVWPANNFLEQARMEYQILKNGGEERRALSYGYGIIYVVLILYTIIFSFTYLKRVLYMAFLTAIAPLVAITYPIDKINDGKAQAFNLWLKEYMFNLLLQPLHLALYMIIIGSAITFAAKNVFYVIMALGFLIPAEKLLRRFFGFEKAQTPGALEGAAGAALMMSGLNRLMSHKPSKNALGLGKKDEDEEEAEADKPIMNKKLEDTDDLFENDDKDGDGLFGIGNTDKEGDSLFGDDDKGGDGVFGNTKNDENIQKNINNLQIPTISRKPIQTPRRKKSVIRGIKRGGRNYLNGLQARYKANKAAKGGIIKRGLRTAGGVAGATTLAAAGGIIGITSGDPSKAAQYMTAGAVGGYVAGKAGMNAVSDKLQVSGTIKEAQKGYYGDQYKEHEQEKYKKQFIKNQENLRKIEEKLKLEEKEAKEVAKRIANYTDYEGVDSVEDAIAVDQLVQDGNYKLEEAIMAANYSNSILEGKDIRKMKRDEIREYQHAYKERLEGKGISEEEAKLHTARLFRAINEFNKFKD